MMCLCSEILVNKVLVPTIKEIKKVQKKGNSVSYLKQKSSMIHNGLIYYYNLLYYPICYVEQQPQFPL